MNDNYSSSKLYIKIGCQTNLKVKYLQIISKYINNYLYIYL